MISVGSLLARRLLGCLMVLARREVPGGCRTPGAPARDCGAAPPDQPGPLPASQPAVARGPVPADPQSPAASSKPRSLGPSARHC